MSTVRPSADTFTQSCDGRGVPSSPTGSGTNGGFDRLGPLVEAAPSAL